MKASRLELIVGVFVALGIASLAYLSIKVARQDFFHSAGYVVQARFSNASGLRAGSPVMIAGVEVGRVKRITLQDYEAKVDLSIRPDIVLQKDVIASVKTKGLIGEKYVELTPGADEERIPPGGLIRDTEPAMDMEGLISKYVHGNVSRTTNGTTASY
jgi:phospholipid/cholesterol/gamma-HCH transport system substrate-binding protein